MQFYLNARLILLRTELIYRNIEQALLIARRLRLDSDYPPGTSEIPRARLDELPINKTDSFQTIPNGQPTTRLTISV
jgi:hypothetical protein